MAHNHCISRRWIHLVLCLVLAAGWLAARPVPAAQAQANMKSVLVDTTVDDNGLSTCEAAPNDCSLRGAITKANGDPSYRYAINLEQNQTYELTVKGEEEDDNATGDLDIHVNITIYGNGSTIDATSLDDRVFDINRASDQYASDYSFFHNLTITGGYAPDGSPSDAKGRKGEDGGGIRIRKGTLEIRNSTIEGNSAGNGANPDIWAEAQGGEGGSGGGIFVDKDGILRIYNSMVSSNYAGNGGAGSDGRNIEGGASTDGKNGGLGGRGGGIYVHSENTHVGFILQDCQVNSNLAGDGGDGGDGGRGSQSPYGNPGGGNGGDGGAAGHGGSGGGLYALQDAWVTNGVFYQNAADIGGRGGAGGTRGWDGYDSSYDGSVGEDGRGGSGGGIAADESDLWISFSTIFKNASGSDGTDSSFLGGGLSSEWRVFLKNSILYGNTASNLLTPDNCRSESGENGGEKLGIRSGGHNLIEAKDGCQINRLASAGRDLFGSDPKIETALTPPEPWMAPLGLQPNSPAIDRVPPALCTDWDDEPIDVDQWGESRPKSRACDSGAIESDYTRDEMVFLPAVIR